MILNKPKIEQIKDIPQCNIGVPAPVVLSDESNILLFYFAQEKKPQWEDVVCMTFKLYKKYKFGRPNDETISGHPLYRYGLQPYSFQLVKNSPWIEELKKMNSVHPCHKDEYFEDYKHFIFFFHDSCFEVVCQSYEYEFYPDILLKDLILEKINVLGV